MGGGHLLERGRLFEEIQYMTSIVRVGISSNNYTK